MRKKELEAQQAILEIATRFRQQKTRPQSGPGF